MKTRPRQYTKQVPRGQAPRVAIAVRVHRSLKEAIGRVAARECRTPSNLVHNIIQDTLCRPRLSPVLQGFVDEIYGVMGSPAVNIGSALSAIDLEADSNPDAESFMRAIEWIAGHRLKSVGERLAMIERLRRLPPGRQTVDLVSFTGWK